MPGSCLNEAVKLAKVFSEVKDSGKLLIHELADLGSPFIVWT